MDRKTQYHKDVNDPKLVYRFNKITKKLKQGFSENLVKLF